MSELDELFPDYSRLNKQEQAVVHMLASKIDTEARVPEADLRQISAEVGLNGQRLVRAHDLARTLVAESLAQIETDITLFERGGSLE